MRAYRLHLGEEALVYRLAYHGDVVAFKMGRRCDPAVEHFDAFSQGVLGSNCVQKVSRLAQRYATCQKKAGITRCARPSALIPFFSGTPLRVARLGY